MEVQAKARFIRISPRKARLTADLVRGKKVQQALTDLAFCRKAGRSIVTKVLKSALANADQLGNIDIDSLFVKRITVDQGPSMKRFRPRAMGRATRIRKRTSHITVILDEK
ncbi:MAG: 50S ribosomal protein L22 [Proteobacteria bacterium]|nr:50S ribosomal protein L22 [Pseudomonadota bacterium]